MATNSQSGKATAVPSGAIRSNGIPTPEKLGQMARQFLDRNVRQYIEQNTNPIVNPNLKPSISNINAVTTEDDQLNIELLQLRHHLTLLSSRGPSANSMTTPPPTATPPPVPGPITTNPNQLRHSLSPSLEPNGKMEIAAVNCYSSSSQSNNNNSNTIYAQVKRSPKNGPPRSKFVEFLHTIEPYHSKRSSNRASSEKTDSCLESKGHAFKQPEHNPAIYYHVGSRDQQSDSIQVDYNRKCLSIVQPQQRQTVGTATTTLNTVGPKLFAFDHLFSGTLPDKLSSLPRALLSETLNCLVQNYVANAVILSIDTPMSDGATSPGPSTLINEFAELTHRGLMLHSIAWIFDAIAHRNRASIKLSVSALSHGRITDLLAPSPSSSTSLESKVCSNQEEVEYSCTSAKSAATYLEQALAAYEQLLKSENSSGFQEELRPQVFLLTIHLYQYRIIRLANGKSKVIGSHSKLYFFELMLRGDPTGGTGNGPPNWPSLDGLLSSWFSSGATSSSPSSMGNSIFSKSKIIQTLSSALMLNDQPNQICGSPRRHSKRSSLSQPPPFGKVSLSVLANIRSSQANSGELGLQLLLNECQLVASIEQTQLLENVCSDAPNSHHGHSRKLVSRNSRANRCSSGDSSCCQCSGGGKRSHHQGRKHHLATDSKECENSVANGSAITSSSEQSFDTVIFRGQLIPNTCTHRQLIEKLNNSGSNKSDGSSGGASSSSPNRKELNSKSDNSGNSRESDGSSSNNNHNNKEKMCYPRSHCRRNSSDSNQTLESTNTKARMKWWSDRRRHRSSTNHSHSSSRKNSQLDPMQNYSPNSGSIRRIRKKKLRNPIWTEELWVDGPKASPIPLNSQNNTNNLTNSINSNIKPTETVNVSSSELNELRKKQQRIEQWIQNTFDGVTNGDYAQPNTNYMTIDQTLFWLNHQPNQEKYLPYGDLVLDNRDTLSDCGDKRSDFYDDMSAMWNGDGANCGTLTKQIKGQATRNMNAVPNYQAMMFANGAVPTTMGFESLYETDCTSEPILVTAEPPKQLKLEQFLQQLSKITIPSLNHQLISGGKSSGQPNSQSGVQNSKSRSGSKGTLEDVLGAIKSGTIVSSSGTLTTSCIVASSSGGNHYHQTSLSSSSCSKQQESVLNKMKRNTTSTTTSGHGTISEGECSSVLAGPIVPGIASKGAKSSGTTGGNNGSATSNSVSTPGSGASAGAPIQRQPASSGYESTIQDDEDEFEEEGAMRLGGGDLSGSGTEVTVDQSGRNCFGYAKKKKQQKRVWTNKLADYSQNGNQAYRPSHLASFRNGVSTISPSGSRGVGVGTVEEIQTVVDVDGSTVVIEAPSGGAAGGLYLSPISAPTTLNDEPEECCSLFCCAIRKSK